MGLAPFLQPEEAANDLGKLVREILGGAVNQCRRFRIASQQNLIQLFLLQFRGRNVTERILVAELAQPLPPILNQSRECPSACTVADKSFSIAQVGIIGVHNDRRKLNGTVAKSRGMT